MATHGTRQANPYVQDASSLEMIRAYVKYKEDRANRMREETDDSAGDQTRNPASRAVASSEFVLEEMRTELPETLHIRKSIAVSRPRSGSNAVGIPANDGKRRRTSNSESAILQTPLNAFKKSAQTLATQVEQLSSQLGLDRYVQAAGISSGMNSVSCTIDVRKHRTSNTSDRPLNRGSRISSTQSATTGALSDVTEESEIGESSRSRTTSAKSSALTNGAGTRAFSGRQQDRSVGRRHPDSTSSLTGNARLMGNMQKLQEVNETLIVHLKKVMEAYKELDSVKVDQEKEFTFKIAEMEQSLHTKDVQIVALQRDLDDLASQSDEVRSDHQRDAAQSQIINAKLAQALQRSIKLQRENEELKKEPKAPPEIQPSTERALLRRIMDLESELARNRDKENEMEKLNNKLREREEEAASVSRQKDEEFRRRLEEQRVSSALRSELDDDRPKAPKQAYRERELNHELETSEAVRAELVKALREVKADLEERTWRIEKYQKDIEKLVKEKDRAYEKMEETQQEYEEKKQQDKKAHESRVEALMDGIDGYKKRVKEADKYLAKIKVRQQELQVQHQHEELQLKSKVDELASTNKQYQVQLNKISSEIMAIDLHDPEPE